jgi:cytochrome c biogenesis protein CcmG/thiol:disulfide interchange protein DsbE
MSNLYRVLRWSGGLVVTLAAVGVVGLFALGLLRASAGQTLSVSIARGDKPAAPGFALPVIWPTGRDRSRAACATSGQQLDIARLRGHPVVLNFWASWCKPCQDEAPLLNAATAEYPDVMFVGVDVQDLPEDARAFLRRYDVPYTSVRDERNETYRAYGLTGVPETFYLNPEGRLVAHDPGAVTFDTLHAGVRRITD